MTWGSSTSQHLLLLYGLHLLSRWLGVLGKDLGSSNECGSSSGVSLRKQTSNPSGFSMKVEFWDFVYPSQWEDS